RLASRLSPITRPTCPGDAPRPSRVPPPRGSTGTPSSPASTRSAAISAFEPGKATASGVRPSRTYGDQSTPARTLPAPTMPRSLSIWIRAKRCPPPALEALSEALLFDGVRPIRGPGLGAGPVAGEHLARVAAPGGVEDVLHLVHARQVGLGEHQ